jgi:Na+/proline symporter
MWNERQWSERRIGLREIAWSWAVFALIMIAVAAWAGAEVLLAEPAVPSIPRTGD